MPVLTFDSYLTAADRRAAMEHDVSEGLCRSPKSLPPIWFYDQRGGELFDQITRLPEYYLTGAERWILAAHATDIARLAAADTLVELGSGTSEKTRLLLDGMAATQRLRRFVPLDVDGDTMRSASADISQAYDIDVHAVVGDFHQHLGKLPQDGRRLVAFLGSTIGNLVPAERERFLGELRGAMADRDHLLLGTDLVKDPDRIRLAYNDPAGVTAAFNRNVLAVLNAELDADFDLLAFEHCATWNEKEEWIEMRLRAVRDHRVSIAALPLSVDFDAGEDIVTEISAKFRPDRIQSELTSGGFAVAEQWADPNGDFLLTLARPLR